MRLWADLHIHSKYSIATSKNSDLENLDLWARYKGLSLIGSGDFTHPIWRQELKEKLAPTEGGLWRLKPEHKLQTGPGSSFSSEVLFVVSGEISTIYKKNGRTRKVHQLILLPGLEEAERLSSRLSRIGNINADGRPILGLDSKDLLEMTLETCPEAIYIPAHIWTPHFSVLGATSGFDSLEECFEDLSGEITALETGLSSDPAMNWRLSALDKYILISNSDAHSPANLAREANLLEIDLSYEGLQKSLTDPQGGFLGTVEFFPEEGKYHWDGHRSCGIRWAPSQTLEADRICPVCGKKVTLGVLHRVEKLADREEGYRPAVAKPYERLVPLAKVISAVEGVGEKSKRVQGIYRKILTECGPELETLMETPLEEVEKVAGVLAAEGIRRVRLGELEINPGFDGEYGEVRILSEDERQALLGQAALFECPEDESPRIPSIALADRGGDDGAVLSRKHEKAEASETLNPEQLAAVTDRSSVVVVLAGPGTGKTKTLTHRCAHLLTEGASPDQLTCVTFTRKAAAEMRRRLVGLLPPGTAARIQVGTFHRLCLNLLHTDPEWRGRPLLSEYELASFFDGGKKVNPREAALAISKLKNMNLLPGDPEAPDEWREIYTRYQEQLTTYGVLDYDELLLIVCKRLEEGKITGKSLERLRHLLVDEFQDLTPLQYRLVKLVMAQGESLFVIGDPDQAIYGFRGADAGVFQRIEEDYPERRVINLVLNYRSAPHIIRAATEMISYNSSTGTAPPVTAANKEPMAVEEKKVRYITAPGETAEGIAVAREIGRLVGGTDMLSAHGDYRGGKRMGSYSFGEIAVLYRTGRQAEVLEKVFAREGFPYRVVGERKLLYHRKVRETVTFLHALLEPEDFLVLSALRLQYFNPGEKEIRRLWKRRQETGQAFLETLRMEERLERSEDEETEGRRETKEAINYLLASFAKYGALRETGVLPMLREWISERDWEPEEDLEKMLGMAALSSDPQDFLEKLTIGREGDLERVGKRGISPEYLSLMTLHAVKGLEFPVVLITGVEEGLLPLIREGDQGEEEGICEERRLFYVGLTRAERELILFSADRRRRGSVTEQKPSRFLSEIPADLLTTVKRKKPKGQHKQTGLF